MKGNVMKSNQCYAGMSVLYKNDEDELQTGKIISLDIKNKEIAWVENAQGQKVPAFIESMVKSSVFTFSEKQSPLPDDLFEGQNVFYENNNGYAPATFKRMHETDENLCWVQTESGQEDLAEIETLLKNETPGSTASKSFKM